MPIAERPLCRFAPASLRRAPMLGLPTGTVTFLFTDIEGSTRLLQQLGDGYADVLGEYRRLLRSAVQERGGQEVDTQGDASFFAFRRARDALIAALAAQRAILKQAWPSGTSIRARMGLHTGEPLSGNSGYVGMDVHRAARIGAAGYGGQILLSQTTHDLVAADLPEGLALRDLGEHQLKDLDRPQRLFQVVAADLPANFPPLRSLEMKQQIRFCTTSDGVRIAYATIGTGAPLVKVANWLSHLEFDWQSPVWRHWLEGLAAGRRLVRYDERGCGLSDWEAEDFSFGAWVRDLEAVVAALDLDRFPLLGISQGGAVAIAYAVRHPQQVSHLILYGSYARGWANRGQVSEERNALLTLTRHGWGKDVPAYRQLWTSLFMPDATLDQMRWFNDLQRVSASPEAAARFQMEFGKINVVDLLPRVMAPTLILHCRNDIVVPFEEGRRIAALIPNARFVPLEGKNHLPQEGDPCWEPLITEVRDFLGISAAPR